MADGKDDRRDKLAQALRANLRRRKAQARGAPVSDQMPADGDPGGRKDGD